MSIVILGGTFNPVHIGHLLLAEEVRHQFNYEKIIFIPANMPVHKETREVIESKHRINMLSLALKNTDYILEDCEILRGGPSYTIDTIGYLKENYKPEGKIGVVIGDDLLEKFSKWKEADRLSIVAELIVAHRMRDALLTFSYPHRYCGNTILPVSSKDIRQRIREGRPYKHLVPSAVADYIERERLYI